MANVLYKLDYLFKFLFINSKGKALINSAHLINNGKHRPVLLNYYNPIVDAEDAKSIYEVQIRRYLGLGFLFSFIPGTEAFTARTEYFGSLLSLHNYIKVDGAANNSDQPYLHYIRLTPLYFLDNFVGEIYTIPPFNERSSLSDLPFNIDHLKQVDWYKTLGHTLLNPIKIVSFLLRLFHCSLVALVFSVLNYCVLAEALRWTTQMLFLPLHVVVAIAEASVDLVLNCLDTLLLDPLRFVHEIAKQFLFLQNKSHEFVYIPSEEYGGIDNIDNILKINQSNDRFKNLVTQSTNQTLSLFFTDAGKEQYLEESRFYKRMKEMDYFANSQNFSQMSKAKIQTLKLFSEWKKFRQLKILAPDISMPDDVLNVVTEKLIDLSDTDFTL
ncbi:MAG: hypothetical protein H0T84_14605 [Tatlockia sp.]|nr:hypothetical protein [Tatlockia sp.]